MTRKPIARMKVLKMVIVVVFRSNISKHCYRDSDSGVKELTPDSELTPESVSIILNTNNTDSKKLQIQMKYLYICMYTSFQSIEFVIEEADGVVASSDEVVSSSGSVGLLDADAWDEVLFCRFLCIIYLKMEAF